MIELSSWEYEALRADGEFTLYRARQDGALSTVLVLKPVSEHPSRESLVRLEHEYSLREELDLEWAVRPIGLTHHWGRTVLVLEDPGGEPLDRFLRAACNPGPHSPGEALARNASPSECVLGLRAGASSSVKATEDKSDEADAGDQPMELGRFLQLAANLAAGLGKLHRQGLIHKDIKPAHILVDPKSNKVWFTGFGISSRLARERQAAEPPEMIAGILAYMAPEQTGRMNRSIDSRSDLYSLGVTLYQMLTGNLPFTASDPMEWVHCHVARQPEPPAGRVEGIPKAVSDIIMKLLAKTAEERYQTAAGVEADLKICLSQWETQARVDDFAIGKHDTPDRLLIPEKLYGRAAEVDRLLASFDRVVRSGRPELVLVSGYSGVGKSSVVNELHKVLVPPRGLFASSKFDQYKRDIPYSTLAQTFQRLIRPLLAKEESELDRWRYALREAVGANGRLIVDLVPELKLIIGEQPPVPVLPPQDAQRRFQLVFRRFISIFARPEHPLALFLDDLQWLDAATLDLLEDLSTRPDVQQLMFIGAYRDNEVDATHPLMRKIEAIRQAGAMVQQIALAPLTCEDLGRLIADSLHYQPEPATPLAQLVHEKTGGNPFFAIQFISALAEEGLLLFEPATAAWSWDLSRIRAKDYTDNLADFMAGKLERLAYPTQEALAQFACLANRVEFAILSLIREETEEAIHAVLWEAVRAGLIIRLDTAYMFLHDRVQEAAYDLIPENERAAVHLRIGKALASRTAPEEIEESIFEIVSQLNRGIGLINSVDERERVAELNLIAASRAKASTAYASALTYLIGARALLPENSWEQRYQLTFALELQRAECEFLTGDFAAAEKLLSMLSGRAANLVDSAAVARLQTELYASVDQNERAVEGGLQYLRRVGIECSVHPSDEQVRQEYERIWQQLGDRPIEALVDLHPMTDQSCRATLDVLTALEEPAFFTDQNLRSLIVARLVNFSLEHGNSDGSCVAYVQLGCFVGTRFGDYQAAFRFGQVGLELVEKHGLERFRARVSQCFGYFIIPWSRHLRSSIESVRRSFFTAQEAGDLKYAVYACDRLVTVLLAAGEPLRDVQLQAETALEFARRANFGYIVDIIVGQLRFIRTLRGLTPSFSSFNDAEFDEGRFEKHMEANPHSLFATCWYWIRKLQARFLAGDSTSAVKASLRAQSLLWTSRPTLEAAEYHFYGALSCAAVCNTAAADECHQHVAILAAHQRQLRVWAEHCPENFENRAALVGAEIARLEGRELDAERLYEQAIRSARANGFVHNEALAYELAARFYTARGFEDIADLYLRKARYCYLCWGADGKVRQLEEMYPYLRTEEPAPGPTSRIEAPVEQLDLATVIKVSQAVSSEIVLEKLLETLLKTALEHAGADRGLLILPHAEQHRVEAEVTTGPDQVEVLLRQAPVPARNASRSDAGGTSSELPESLFRYVIRTQEKVILDDATAQNLFSEDEYVRQRRPRSVLCLPLAKQGKLMGVLYLENNLAPGVFTPKRLATLELLASQAAISLDHARVYAELTQENSERRKAEEALRASEERWRKLFENSSAGIALIAPDGRYLATNLALQKMLGYTEEELNGLAAADLMSEEEHAACEQLRTEAIRGLRRAYRVERRLRRKDHTVIWTDVSAVLVPAAANQSAFFAVVIVDISERKRVEEELRRSEAFLAQGQRIGHTGSWGWKVVTGEVYWSEEHFRIFEFDPETDKPSYSLFMERIHPEDRAPFEELVNRAVRDKSDFENDHRIVLPDRSIKFLRSVGQASVNSSGELEFIGTVMDVTDLKRAEEMQIAIAREREMLVRQRAVDLAKANEALRSCLDALASVPELDQFVGQVMAVITGQLGAASGALALFDDEKKSLQVELLFQDGRVMSPAEGDYPERFRSMLLKEEQLFAVLNKPITVMHLSDRQASIRPDGLRDYFLRQGIETLLIVPLISHGEIYGFLSFRFAEKRDFQAEELEIARALATQASLAIQLTQLAKTAKRSAVLEERNRLAGEIHDSLAQSFAGICMQLVVAAEETRTNGKEVLSYIERAIDLSKFGLSEARCSSFSLRSNIIEESGLIDALKMLVERSNIPGRLRCTFRSNRVPEEILSHQIQHDLLRIAQESISNALRHAQPTDISVRLRWNPPNLVLKVTDNGSGFVTNRTSIGGEGFRFASMRARANNLGAKLEVRSKLSRGTSVVVRLPVAFEPA
jgi:PAS domain S-box-containing protein